MRLNHLIDVNMREQENKFPVKQPLLPLRKEPRPIKPLSTDDNAKQAQPAYRQIIGNLQNRRLANLANKVLCVDCNELSLILPSQQTPKAAIGVVRHDEIAPVYS